MRVKIHGVLTFCLGLFVGLGYAMPILDLENGVMICYLITVSIVAIYINIKFNKDEE